MPAGEAFPKWDAEGVYPRRFLFEFINLLKSVNCAPVGNRSAQRVSFELVTDASVRRTAGKGSTLAIGRSY